MKKLFWITSLIIIGCVCAKADPLDSLQAYLEKGCQVQEKVYVHTDNTCYYVGDTIWYKAYVLRADDLRPTDMSKILYVELLSPDGLVAERQRIIVSDKGFTNGQFVLKDSLYSGYYEIRAYTRWMLNFNVFERPYTRDDRHKFYNNQMAKDFFRDWDGLYSRVIPIYSKPDEMGDYDGKYMYSRPKQEIVRPKKDKLTVTFFPEGGQLVEGLKSRVAFEVIDQNGQAVDIEGTLSDGQKLSTTYMGRGTFTLTPTTKRLDASFSWKGKDYSFTLPKAISDGVTIEYDPEKRTATLQTSSSLTATPMALAVLCRGKLCHFQKLSFPLSPIDLPSLPTGVNELMVMDGQKHILASRMVFVNNHDVESKLEISTGGKSDFMPYEPIDVTVNGCEGVFSIAVRDTRTDDPTYDNGNMLTDMLLSSDVKGFVANPMYYFSKDDSHRRAALDLLMMVQGWRKYNLHEKLRYKPETSLTIEGSVYKLLGNLDFLDIDDVAKLNNIASVTTEMNNDLESSTGIMDGTTMAESTENQDNAASEDASLKESSGGDDSAFADLTQADLGVNHGGLRHEVLVEAEVNTYNTGESAGAVQLTKNGGRFVFVLPPYYGEAVVFMKAYNVKDSVKKSMANAIDDFMNDQAYPDYYVKQDLFYPVFAHEYSYYQNHIPPVDFTSYVEEDTTAYLSKLDGDHTLSTVDVRARRRGRRSIDYTKPAYVVDAYDLYNEATDRGLSWGISNMGYFPPLACFTVYGNMRRYKDFNVQGKIDTYTFYRNYSDIQESIKNRSDAAVFKDLMLNRIQNFRFFTDYEPRNVDSLRSESVNRADITLVYETIPDDGKRPTYRDRRYSFPGFSYPEAFYNPDYSAMKPEEPTDYRRTLYWNPNAKPDENGHFAVTLYNNSRETRVQVSAAGVTSDGKIYVTK